MRRIASEPLAGRASIGAMQGFLTGNESIKFEDTLDYMQKKLRTLHDPVTWRFDVTKKIDLIRHGQW